MIVTTLPDPEQHPHWPGIYRLLARAAARGDGRPYDDRDLVWIVIDDRQIIAALTACLTTEGNIEIVNAAGYRAAEWVEPMVAALEKWGRLAGARSLIVRGRKGWVRLLDRLGWKAIGREGKHMIIEKVLA